MADTCGDVTHRAYELALGEGLGFWERSARVTPYLAPDRSRPGLLSALGGARRRKVGHLMLHTFDGGLVVERLRGGVRGVPYSSVTAALLEIDSADGLRGAGLRLTFDDGKALVIVETQPSNVQPLIDVAGRCQTSSRSHVSYEEALAASAEPQWI